MKPLIVYDLDDTLYLEREYVRSGLRAVGRWAATEFGISGVGEAAWAQFSRGVRHTTISDAFASLGRPLSSEDVVRAVDVYRCHEPDISLCPDAAELLPLLVDHAYLAVITDGPRQSQRAKLAALGLPEIMHAIIVTDEHTGWSKPAKDAFRWTQEHFNVSFERCMYIADNPAKDFAAPLSLGWRVARLARPGGLHESAPCPVPIDTVTSLAEIESLRGLVTSASPESICKTPPER